MCACDRVWYICKLLNIDGDLGSSDIDECLNIYKNNMKYTEVAIV